MSGDWSKSVGVIFEPQNSICADYVNAERLFNGVKEAASGDRALWNEDVYFSHDITETSEQIILYAGDLYEEGASGPLLMVSKTYDCCHKDFNYGVKIWNPNMGNSGEWEPMFSERNRDYVERYPGKFDYFDARVECVNSFMFNRSGDFVEDLVNDFIVQGGLGFLEDAGLNLIDEGTSRWY